MTANTKSGNVSGLIAVFGLMTMVAGLVIMLLLPEIRLSAWVLFALGTLLLAVAFIIDFRRVGRAIVSRPGRFRLGTGVMVSLFAGITLLVNAISMGNYHRFDTSSLAQFTLTPQTINVLTNLKSPVKAIGFFTPNDSSGIVSHVTSLLAEYQNHARQLTVRYIDPDQHPDQAKQYGITLYQTVVFESGNRDKLVPPTQFLMTDQQGNPAGIQAEHPFTSAILEVTGAAQKKVYFLAGHGEGDINSNFSKAKEALLNELYLVDTLNLITNPGIPGDCAALIIGAPRSALSDHEVKTITDYLSSGGQVLVLTNPDSSPDIAKIVSPWGVDIGKGTVIDLASFVSPDPDIPLVSASKNYFLLPTVYFPGATAIIPQGTVPSNVQMMPLAYTGNTSWLDRDFTAGKEPVFNPKTEKRESLAIGVVIAGVKPAAQATGKFTRLVVIGDSDFASNAHFGNANNGDLFLNSVNWLAEETSLVSIRRSVQPFRRLVVTQGQANIIQWSSTLLFPSLLLVAAGVIWWRRKQR